MSHWKITFGILALIPACFPGSCITCAGCRSAIAWEIQRKDIPSTGICNVLLPEGGHCNVERTQKYFKCSSDPCSAITVKNKEFRSEPKEGCEHDNRHVVPNIPQLPSLEASSSSSDVRSEILPGGTRLYHFLDVNKKE
ncbi:hypothetical protein PGTUg99_028810 [Puccinia graminis f. sp. tritici]|uniref:Uncharacterized protein n=1 Tax=Puccinia graminis f. sp. tritici TaxID=56615 RepID=A0A5B0RZ19_PUCGR|nr:hypothetical protein PGTUg99_028810 [Puccinia graminis f. sp. tritici]